MCSFNSQFLTILYSLCIKVFCIFLFLTAASLFGTIIAQVCFFQNISSELWMEILSVLDYIYKRMFAVKLASYFVLENNRIIGFLFCFRSRNRILSCPVFYVMRCVSNIQVNEIVAQNTNMTKDLDTVLETYQNLTPK